MLILAMNPVAVAGELFGPPQTISKEAGGLNTAVGYRYHEDTYRNHADYVLRQNQLYSQVAYGAANRWEISGRIGLSDLKIFNAFRATDVSTTTSKDHFEENWKFFGTLGAKGFFPINNIFGVGAFLQSSYTFGKFTDETTGRHNTTPFAADLEVKNLWDVNFGIGFQATVPFGIKLYGGPYVYYAEADARFSDNIQGLPFGTEKTLLRNKSAAGGYFGADIPMVKGFRLNIEGQYTDRFSCGSAITYTY